MEPLEEDGATQKVVMRTLRLRLRRTLHAVDTLRRRIPGTVATTATTRATKILRPTLVKVVAGLESDINGESLMKEAMRRLDEDVLDTQ